MKIVEVKQKSDEWFELRKKRMTASHAQQIGSNGKGLVTYIREIMCEYFSNHEKELYTNKAMEWGNEQEPIARTVYEFETDSIVKEIGFIIYDDYIGCSPDGFVGKDGLLEIKCPTDKVFFSLLLDEKIDSKYMWQMQMQMLISGRKWCDYFAYNPNFKQSFFLKRVFPDKKKFEKLLEGLGTGKKLINEINQKIGNQP